MKLTRRNFLAWAGIAATGAVACDLFDDELRVQSPAAIPEDLVSGRDNWYATYDAAVPGGAGLLVRVMEGRAKKVRGNPRFPTNQGKQSAAADAILQSLYHPDRIAGPMLRNGPRGSGQFRPIGWEEALNRFNAALDERGAGMLLVTEPRNAGFARIADAFANAFGGRRLAFDAVDDAGYRSAVREVLGGINLPYYDIARAETIASFGSDFLSSWGSPTAYSVGYGKFRAGEYTKHRGSHYHFDARYSLTAANADKWLPIAPGAEGYAALALAWSVIQTGAAQGDVARLTGGQGAAALDRFRPDTVAGDLQIPDAALGGETLAGFFEMLAKKLVGQGLVIGGGGAAGAYSNGRFNAAAALALNDLLGNVGQPGGLLPNPGFAPSGMTGNAAPATLNDWRRAVSDIDSGATRLVIVHNADPVYGLPNGVGLRGALMNENVTIISASPFIDETSVLADVIIPDRAALEEWGDHIPEHAPGYAVYGLQQPVVNPLPDLDPRSFADVMLTAGADLGKGELMPAGSYEELIREAVSDIGGDFTEALKNGGVWNEEARLAGGGRPGDGLLNNIVEQAAEASMVGSGEFQLLPYPHHTILDGRHAHLPWAQSTPDPLTTVAWQTWVDLNEEQARQMGLREGDVVTIRTDAGSISALVYLNPGTPPGIAAVPMGGGRQSGSEYAAGREARESGNVLSILAVAEVDGAGGLAWCGNRCSIIPTGESMAVSKMEGDYTSREIGEHSVERVFKSVSAGEGSH